MRDNWHRGFEYLEQRDLSDVLVTFLSHDDYFYSDFLMNIANLVETEPEATLYQTMFDLIDQNGRLRRACQPVPAREPWRELAAMLCWNLRDSFGTGYAYRAKDYLAVGGIPNLPFLLYADHLLYLRLTRRGYKACSPSIDFAYRLHRGSTNLTINARKMNGHAEALHLFEDALSREFGELYDSDVGRAAIASVLARSLFLFDTPIVRWNMTADNKHRIGELERKYHSLARGVPIGDLAGWPSMPSRVINMLRQLNMMVNFLRPR